MARHRYDRPMSELRELFGDEAMSVKCLANEADAYRQAVVQLISASYPGGRKTIDKAEVHDIAGRALDTGNAWSRRGKGEAWETTIGALR
jgi:hypothetical protein